jgi:hypothetical protein
MGFSGRYMAAHLLLPRLVASAGARRVLDAVEQKDEAYFVPVWMEAGFRFRPSFVHAQHAGYRFGVLTLPKPQEMTEAYLGLVAGKLDASDFGRYFTLEHSINFATPSEAATVIGEWRDGTHFNHGPGPRPTGDLSSVAWELVQAVVPRLLG